MIFLIFVATFVALACVVLPLAILAVLAMAKKDDAAGTQRVAPLPTLRPDGRRW